MHATTGANAPLANMKIQMDKGSDVVDNQAGFFLSQRLRDRIGENSGKHILHLEPRLSRAGFGLSANDVAARYDSNLTMSYKLIDAKTGETLTNGSIKAVSTFGAPLDPYGLVSANKNAVQQTAKEAADRLLVKLAGYYANPKP